MVLKRVLDGLKVRRSVLAATHDGTLTLLTQFKCRYGGSGCEWAAAAGEEEAHAKGEVRLLLSCASSEV